MKPGTSKSKGNAFEWKIAKELSLWWSYGERNDIFCKTDTSGARATVRAKSGLKTDYQYGDITISDPIGAPLIERYNIEVKHYNQNSFSLDDLLKEAKGNLFQWWEQSCNDAEVSQRRPLLIAKKNYYPTILIMSKEESWLLDKYAGTSWINHAYNSIKFGDIYIMLYDKFLKILDPQIIKEIDNDSK